MKRFIIFTLIMLSFSLRALVEDIEPSPPHKGNYAHDLTPFSTFSFGQNIFEKNTFFVYPILTQCAGRNFSEIELIPAILYAPTDNFSFYTGLPIVLKDRSDGITQRGIGDFFIQCEYALADHSTTQAESLLTVLGSINFPTTHLSVAHDCMETSTNYAATSFFIGTTASRVSVEWYVYAAVGATVYTKKHGLRSGTEILYEWGIGHTLGTTQSLTFAGLCEFNGIYTLKDSVDHCPDPDTGGNILLAGPTLSITGDWLVLTGGIQLPLFQKLNGEQDKTKYRTSLQLVISF